MNQKIRLGILGGGSNSLIGVLHRVASYMFERYEITGGVFSRDEAQNLGTAEELGISTRRVYRTWKN